jgi:hypothetical protein
MFECRRGGETMATKENGRAQADELAACWIGLACGSGGSSLGGGVSARIAGAGAANLIAVRSREQLAETAGRTAAPMDQLASTHPTSATRSLGPAGRAATNA